jgi:PAS domain S-box-containing protein
VRGPACKSKWVGAACLLGLFVVILPTYAAERSQAKHVLILYSFTARDPISELGRLELTLGCAARHRDQIFPGSPILLFAVMPRWLEEQKLPSIREWILLAVILMCAAVLGVALRRRSLERRKFRVYLREGEERFRRMGDSMPLLIWLSDADGRLTYVNQAALSFTGMASEVDLIKNWTAQIHPDDRREAIREFEDASENQTGFSSEFRLHRADGEYRCVLDMAAPRFNQDGSFAGLIGYASDVTEQRKAREALRNVGGRLIEAQEKERSRIARDLHDDICQKLALLSMELEMSKRMVLRPGGPVEVRLEEMRRQCAGIAADVQALSHELHSSRLDYLGLTVALQSFCEEFSQQQNVSVEFESESVPGALPKAIALTLFRIAQEGLRNSLKHSGVSHFSLRLRGSSDILQMEISDSGAGFEVDEARGSKGLGLISMRERAHLVNGTLAVESRPGGGTRILVCVPFEEESTGDLDRLQFDGERSQVKQEVAP